MLKNFQNSLILNIFFVQSLQIIFFLNIINESFSIFYIDTTNLNLIKQFIFIFISSYAFFIFIIKKNYKNKAVLIFAISMIPFLFNGFVGIYFYLKALILIFLSYYFFLIYKNRLVLKKLYFIFQINLIILALIILSLSIYDFFYEKKILFFFINHTKDLGIMIIFNLFFYFCYHPKLDNIKINIFYILSFISIILIESKSSLLVLILFFLFKVVSIKIVKKIMLSFLLIFILLFTFMKTNNYFYEISNNKIITVVFDKLNHYSSFRLSRINNPCSWAYTHYGPYSRVDNIIFNHETGFKSCNYSDLNNFTLLPILFLNSNPKIIYDQNKEFKINKFLSYVRSFNLDNSYLEFVYFNGILSLIFLFFIIFSYIKLLNQKYINKFHSLSFFFPLLIFFFFESGLFSFNNLLSILIFFFPLTIYSSLRNND